MKRALLITLLALVLAAQAHASRPRWLPPLWYGIAMCEEQLDWRVSGPTYEGAFGFWYGTWDTYRPDSYPDNAGLATPWQQYQVALNVAFRGNTNTRYGHHGPAGLTAWGAYRNGCYRTYAT